MLRQPIDWKAFFDLCGLWDPLTHTFFTSSGELTILLEEVSVLLDTRQADSSIYSRDAYLQSVGFIVVLEDLVLDGRINLASLWKFFSKQRGNIWSVFLF